MTTTLAEKIAFAEADGMTTFNIICVCKTHESTPWVKVSMADYLTAVDKAGADITTNKGIKAFNHLLLVKLGK